MPKRSAHKKQTDKVPLKEAAALNWRAFQIWWELSPRFFISTTLFALVSVLAPYGRTEPLEKRLQRLGDSMVSTKKRLHPKAAVDGFQ